ncbi:hypothetical protein [Rummeliibacillus suwonensis]|uniref:hypothetical protein n=1 Tax=Rummeliibacillus suwonensis TaxID=1306154 RepID=UPI00289EF9F6|nr:hypothetical protein [Rummeliibacillus suwonensis]
MKNEEQWLEFSDDNWENKDNDLEFLEDDNFDELLNDIDEFLEDELEDDSNQAVQVATNVFMSTW